GRPEAAFVLDRLLDRAARTAGLDPAELRRRNLIRPHEMPYRTGLTYRDGALIAYDPADYVAAFDLMLARLDYAGWRDEQKRRAGRRSAWGSRRTWKGRGSAPSRAPTSASIRRAPCSSTSGCRRRDRPTRPRWLRSRRASSASTSSAWWWWAATPRASASAW